MSHQLLTESDLAELRESRPATRQADPIDLAVGHHAFVVRHRFDVHVQTKIGPGPRLSVSRFYWAATPPTAVDFVRDLRGGALYSVEQEIAAKRSYFEAAGIRYVIAADEFDEDCIRPTAVAPSDGAEAVEGTRPLTAPRRRRG